MRGRLFALVLIVAFFVSYEVAVAEVGNPLSIGNIPKVGTEVPNMGTPAAMMDTLILGPHQSGISGELVQNLWRWYGIPPHCLLSVIAAETSLGDPRYGGRLITEGHHNYGCLRFVGYTSKWGMLATGTVEVAGKLWYSFPSMEIGMMALGRYLKVGPASDPGYYLRCFRYDDWYEAVASVYYGRRVAGYWQYVAELRSIDARLKAVAASAGFLW